MDFPESVLVCSRSGLGRLQQVAVTGSTNDDLVDGARSGDTSPAVLVADHQIAGRGRLDRSWIDHGDGLLVSVRLPADPAAAGLVTMAVALAVRHAVDLLTVENVLIKWPNDLVVSKSGSSEKIAGILAEFVAGSFPVVVVGFGINMVPDISRPDATSIVECGGTASRDELLAEILAGIGQRIGDPKATREEMKSHSATVGRRVRVELPGGDSLVGLATALDDHGRLSVLDDSGVALVVSAGDVVHLKVIE